MVDARGTPLGPTLSGANQRDSVPLAAMLDAIPGIRRALATLGCAIACANQIKRFCQAL